MLLLDEFNGASSASIDASPEDVFAAVTDISRLPDWNARIQRVVTPPGRPLAPGVEWVVELRAMGSKWNSRSTVTEYDPQRRVFGYTSRTDDGNPSQVDWRWEVSPEGEGGSRVDVGMRVLPRTFWRRALFAKIRRRQLTDELPSSLQALTTLATARA
jgi:uncharacterized protein YndB with AHSA1/START domain